MHRELPAAIMMNIMSASPLYDTRELPGNIPEQGVPLYRYPRISTTLLDSSDSEDDFPVGQHLKNRGRPHEDVDQEEEREEEDIAVPTGRGREVVLSTGSSSEIMKPTTGRFHTSSADPATDEDEQFVYEEQVEFLDENGNTSVVETTMIGGTVDERINKVKADRVDEDDDNGKKQGRGNKRSDEKAENQAKSSDHVEVLAPRPTSASVLAEEDVGHGVNSGKTKARRAGGSPSNKANPPARATSDEMKSVASPPLLSAVSYERRESCARAEVPKPLDPDEGPEHFVFDEDQPGDVLPVVTGRAPRSTRGSTLGNAKGSSPRGERESGEEDSPGEGRDHRVEKSTANKAVSTQREFDGSKREEQLDEEDEDPISPLLPAVPRGPGAAAGANHEKVDHAVATRKPAAERTEEVHKGEKDKAKYNEVDMKIADAGDIDYTMVMDDGSPSSPKEQAVRQRQDGIKDSRGCGRSETEDFDQTSGRLHEEYRTGDVHVFIFCCSSCLFQFPFAISL